MKFAYFIITFFILNATNAHCAQQTIIPIVDSEVTHHISTENKSYPRKKTKFKRNFARHSKFKKVFLYSGCAVGGILAGICLFTVGLPVIISTILIGIEIVVGIKGYLIRVCY